MTCFGFCERCEERGVGCRRALWAQVPVGEASVVIANIFAHVLPRDPYISSRPRRLFAKSHIAVEARCSIAAIGASEMNHLRVISSVRCVFADQVQVIHGRGSRVCALTLSLFLAKVQGLKRCQCKIACHVWRQRFIQRSDSVRRL